MLNIGDSLEIKDTVTPEMLAVYMGSGDLEVLATPAVVALMENAASTLAKKGVGDDFTTVGTMINIEHVSPTPVAAEIRAKAVLKESDGRFFKFDIEAYDEKGLIAKGEHTRVSVNSGKFQKKADEKFSEV
ncbi:MAG: thioesterase family protein [Ruminococcus sp.]|nr:thioesterase family protein [Ruminococcus sp.]